jgi:hypothetical protein
MQASQASELMSFWAEAIPEVSIKNLNIGISALDPSAFVHSFDGIVG